MFPEILFTNVYSKNKFTSHKRIGKTTWVKTDIAKSIGGGKLRSRFEKGFTTTIPKNCTCSITVNV